MKQGQMIAGKYRLNRVLGTGGMATVWSATNVFTERQFAIKFLLPQVARTADADRRFLLEAKVSARINHPNIIEVIDVGQAEDGALFLVMELLTGMSLEEAVGNTNPALGVRDFLIIMRDVATALAAAHRRGVIHRDLKPSNVFLHRDRDNRLVAKVLDFGVSKILDGGSDASLTIVGTVLGSPLYMSPEQALGSEGIDQRTDVFSFGAILFEALCGERPFSATNLNGLIVAIATTQPKAIDELAPGLPLALRALVRECLATDKSRRIASLDPVIERLTLVIDSTVGSSLRLPARRLSSPSDSLGSAQVSSQPEASRRATSVSPHALPTPDAPVVDLKALAPGAYAMPRAGRSRLGTLARLGVGATLAACAIGVAWSAGFSGRFYSTLSAGGHAPPTSVTDPSAPSAPSSAATVPVDTVEAVAVDSLPPSKRAAAAIKRAGRLSVASMPSWCALSVDGILHGLTPVASFDLTPGTHRLDCVPPSGKTKSTTVSVTEGGEAHYQFVLEDSR
jgi:serine/threonine protein kinase